MVIYLSLRKIQSNYLFLAAFVNLYWISLFILSDVMIKIYGQSGSIGANFLGVQFVLALGLVPLLLIDIVLFVVFIIRLSKKSKFNK